jgi:uncharacterized damage-inducible protein DinB
MRGWSGCVAPIIQKPSWQTYDPGVGLHKIRSVLVDTGDSWLAKMKESHEQGLPNKERRLNQVFHLITHGSHHRGQLLSMVTLMGYAQPFAGGDFGGWSKTAM